MVADKGGRAAALDKQCQLAEARANEAEREAEELRPNIFVRKLALGRHYRRGGGGG